MISSSKPNPLLAFAILAGAIFCVYSIFSPFLENLRSLKNQRNALQQEIISLKKDNSKQSLAAQKTIEQLNSLSQSGFLHRSSEVAIRVETLHGFIKDILTAHKGRILQFQTSKEKLNSSFAGDILDISFVLPTESFPSLITGLDSPRITATIESLMISKSMGGQQATPYLNGHFRLKVLSVDTATVPVELRFRLPESDIMSDQENSTELSGLLNRQVRQAIRSESLEHLDLLGITLSGQTGSALFRDSTTGKTIQINSGDYYFDWKVVELTAASVSMKRSQSNSSVRFSLGKD